ncbi:MAG: hypothetical protein JO128_24245 [Alphaproteobacteria bacterium]|nr:hypothetical protein [Alphaproteobacteria bacterium]
MAGRAQAFEWIEDEISYAIYPYARTPGTANGGSINKQSIELTHIDGWSLGTNFINVAYTKSNDRDPSNGPAGSRENSGAAEYFTVWRSSLSGNRVFDTKALTYEPIFLSDVSLNFGANLGVKNNSFASNTRAPMIGPKFSFDLPNKGFLDFSPMYYKEWNHNGIVGKSDDFDGTWLMELGFAQPFTVAGVPLSFKGFVDITGPKGKDSFGNQTDTETLVHVKVVADLGQMLFGIRNRFEAGPGFQYWYNKFGNDHKLAGNTGTVERTPFFTATYKF